MNIFRKIFGGSATQKERATNVVSVEEWTAIQGDLLSNPNVTVQFRFTNGKSFTLPEFVSGDETKITGRVNGILKPFWRKGVTSVELVSRNTTSFAPMCLDGVVKTWKSDRGFGFIQSDDGKQDFYFNVNTIRDRKLKEDLDKGLVKQRVRFRIIGQSMEGRSAAVEVVGLLERGKDQQVLQPLSRSPEYSMGWNAKMEGELDKALSYFQSVINRRDDVNYHSAIKEYAECLNQKGGAVEAYDFLEAHRHDFSDADQISLDRMQVLYLQKARRIKEEIELLEKILKRTDLPENQRRHYGKLAVTLKKRSVDDGSLQEDAIAPNDAAARKNLDSMKSMIVNDLSVLSLAKIGKFIGKKACAERWNDKLLVDTFALLNDAREFIGTVNYEKRLSWCRRIEGRVEDCINAHEKSDEYEEYVEPLLVVLKDAIRADMVVDGPEFTLVHSTGSASYAVDENGYICLRLSLKLKDVSMPSASEIMATVVGQDDASISVCDLLTGEARCNFELAYKPNQSAMELSRDVIQIQLNFSVEGVDGATQSSWLSKPMAIAIERAELPPLENKYKEYAEGKRPSGIYFVGGERAEKIENMKIKFESAQGGVCYMLHGQRRTGKTTLRDNLFAKIDDRKVACSWEKISMRGVGGDPRVAFYEQLRDDVAMKLGVDSLYLERECNELYSKDSYTNRIRHFSNKLHEKGYSSWVVAVDEFTDVFRSNENKDDAVSLTGIFRNMLDSQVFHLMIIGMDSLVEFQKGFQNNAVVWGDCALSYLYPKDLEELLRIPLERQLGNKCFADNTTVFSELSDWSGGVPQLAQMICAGLVDKLNSEDRRRVVDGDVDDVCSAMVKDYNTSMLTTLFNTFTEIGLPGVDDRDWLDIYIEIARNTTDGGTCKKEALDCWKLEEPRVQFLIERGALQVYNGGNDIRLRARFMAEWIRQGRPIGEYSGLGKNITQ